MELVPRMTLADAKIILEAAEGKARQMGVPMDIAVVDDGAKITSIDIAINKAFTAAGARTPTHQYAGVAGAGGPAFGIHVSNRGRFMIFGGGLPIFVDGQIVGGVGVSSGTADQDREVALAGIDALKTTQAGEGRKVT